MNHDIFRSRIATMILFQNEGKVALLLRKNTAWMDNYYGLPGGKVEKDESLTQAAIRESKEETGVDISAKDLKHLLTLYRQADDGTWLDIIFEAKKWQGKLINAEPHKHSELIWADPDNLPVNTIPSTVFYLKSIKNGTNYAEYGWTGQKV